MEEISLTGATLTSDVEEGVEMAKTSQAQPHQCSKKQNGHNGGKACCPKHMVQSQVPEPISIEMLLHLPPSEVFKAFSALIRLGSYASFDPLLKVFIEKKGDEIAAVLDVLAEDGYSLLHWAAKRVDDVRFLKLLCSHVSPETISIQSSDSVAMTPLHWACTEGSVPHVATLLRFGASMESRDKSGCTPLLIASQYGQAEVAAFLLQKGADGRAVDGARDTALHWAAYKGSIQVCGLLLFRGELHWTTLDSFGQTPLHLSSLRGHTTVVKYLLQEGTKSERRQLLFLKDKNGKTPLDLAVHRKRLTVAAVLREAMEALEPQRGSMWRQIRSTARQFFSVHSWKIWIGCHASNDEIDEAPKLPFYWFILHLVFYALWYPMVFLPVNESEGIMYDLMGWHMVNLVCMVALFFCLYKTHVTDPGTLDEKNPKTAELRRLYEETLELYADYADEATISKQMRSLCHTCHIAKPLRSKHCRITGRCVLLFDHYCPFVANAVGLYNYRWFYMMVFFLTLCAVGFMITLGIYLHRLPTFNWTLFLLGSYFSLYILLGGGLCIYHSQLSVLNLTTNEHQNMPRYKYLRNERGQFQNAFHRGSVYNVADRCFPGDHTYTIPESHRSLLENDEAAQSPV